MGDKLKTFFSQLINSLKGILAKHIDKVAHFSITYGITYTLAHHFNINLAIGVAILVGIGKEFLDRWLGGKFSVGDIMADIAGIIIAYFIFRW